MDPDTDGPRIRARIGVVPQLDNLDTELTVRQNLQIYGRYFGLSRAHVRAKATELLAFAQLTDRADEPVEPLSGGMKRRLTIARSLVNDPELLLLDEPTTGLDPQARHLLWERLYRLKREGVTQIITTHYMDEAEQLCDRLVVMDAGVIVAEGSPAELIGRYSTREVLELRFTPELRPRPTRWSPLRRAGGGAARPAAALHRRRRARPRRGATQRGSGRCPRWCGAPRWRTCSCGSPAGRWWTDGVGIGTRPDRAVPGPAGRAARRRALLDLVPAQLAGHGRVVGPAAAAVPAGVRRGLRLAGRRHRPGRRGHRRASTTWCGSRPRCWRCRRCRAAAFESTYPVLSGFKWQRIYHAMTAGADHARRRSRSGTSTWMAAKIAGSGAIYVVGDRGVRRGQRPGHRGRRCSPRCSPARRSPRWSRRSRPRCRSRARRFRRALPVRGDPDDAVLRHVLPGRPAPRWIAAASPGSRRCGTAPSWLARPRSDSGSRWPRSVTSPTWSRSSSASRSPPVVHPAARPVTASSTGRGPRRRRAVLSAAAGGQLRGPLPRAAAPLGHGVPPGLAGVRVRLLRAGVLPRRDGAGARLAGRHAAGSGRRADQLRGVHRAGAARGVGDERCGVRLDVQRVLQAQVRAAVRRDAGHAARTGGHRARRDRLGTDPRRALRASAS